MMYKDWHRSFSWYPWGAKYFKEKLTNQKILIYGAGTAGMGIANIILDEMKEQGLSEKDAKNLFYLVDKQGLLSSSTHDLTSEQSAF